MIHAAVALLALVATTQGTWSDPEKARAEDPDFALQGEYTNGKDGLQIVALGKGKFFAATLKGGLPGDGWDGKSVTYSRPGRDKVKSLLDSGDWKSSGRTSPTAGAKPPKGAIVLCGKEGASGKDAWKGAKTEGGLVCEGTSTTKKYGSFKLHLEFRTPYKPNGVPGSQSRGNSGLYIFNRYEVQILDSFGLHYYHVKPDDKNAWRTAFEKDQGSKPQSDRSQWCACFYKFKTPDVNASLPPLQWQTYDITFTAPKFKGKKKTANARITVKHNGIVVHDDVELPKGTGAGGKRAEVPKEGLYLQGHGNPVRFRNIRLVEVK